MEEPPKPDDLLGPIMQQANYLEWPFMGEKEVRYQVRWVDDPDSEAHLGLCVCDIKFQHESTAVHKPTSPLFKSLCHAVNKMRIGPRRSIESLNHGLSEGELEEVINGAKMLKANAASLRARPALTITAETWLKHVVYPAVGLAKVLQTSGNEAQMVKSCLPRKQKRYPIMRLTPPIKKEVRAETPSCILWAEITDKTCDEQIKKHLHEQVLEDLRTADWTRLQVSFFGHSMQEDLVDEESEETFWFDLAMWCFPVFAMLKCVQHAVPETNRFKSVHEAVIPLCLWSTTHVQLVAATFTSDHKIDIYALRRWYLCDVESLSEMILVMYSVLDWGTTSFMKWFQGLDK